MIRRLLAIAVLSAAAALGASPANADPGAPPWADPHYPDAQHGSCEGGHGGAFGFGWCDGQHYSDGSYWHQVFGAGTDAAKPHCVVDNGSPQPPPASPGACGGYG